MKLNFNNTIIFIIGVLCLLFIFHKFSFTKKESFNANTIDSWNIKASRFLCRNDLDLVNSDTSNFKTICDKYVNENTVDKLSKLYVDDIYLLSNETLQSEFIVLNKCPNTYTQEDGILYSGGTMERHTNSSIDQCIKLANMNEKSVGFVFNKQGRVCHLKHNMTDRDNRPAYISYTKKSGKSQFTISLWINIGTISSKNTSILKIQDSGKNKFLTMNIAKKTSRLGVVFSDDGKNVYLNSNVNLTLNKWYHVAFVVCGLNYKFYVNGLVSKSGELNLTYNEKYNTMIIGQNHDEVLNNRISKLRVFSVEVPKDFIHHVLLYDVPKNMDCKYDVCNNQQKYIQQIMNLGEHGKNKNKDFIPYLHKGEINKTLKNTPANRGFSKDGQINMSQLKARPIELVNTVSFLDNSNLNFICRRPYCSKNNGIIHLTGTISTTKLEGTDLGYLPIGYRPSETLVFTVGINFGSEIHIMPSGQIKIANNQKTHYITFDGIKYVINTKNAPKFDFKMKRLTRYVRVLKKSDSDKIHVGMIEIEIYDEKGNNLAIGKHVTQSSYLDKSTDHTDFNLIGSSNIINTSVNDQKLAHTGFGLNEWIMVDLGGQGYEVTRVKLYNRTDCCGLDLANCKIQLLDIHQNEIMSDTWNMDGHTDFARVDVTERGNKCLPWSVALPYRMTGKYVDDNILTYEVYNEIGEQLHAEGELPKIKSVDGNDIDVEVRSFTLWPGPWVSKSRRQQSQYKFTLGDYNENKLNQTGFKNKMQYFFIASELVGKIKIITYSGSNFDGTVLAEYTKKSEYINPNVRSFNSMRVVRISNLVDMTSDDYKTFELQCPNNSYIKEYTGTPTNLVVTEENNTPESDGTANIKGIGHLVCSDGSTVEGGFGDQSKLETQYEGVTTNSELREYNHSYCRTYNQGDHPESAWCYSQNDKTDDNWEYCRDNQGKYFLDTEKKDWPMEKEFHFTVNVEDKISTGWTNYNNVDNQFRDGYAHQRKFLIYLGGVVCLESFSAFTTPSIITQLDSRFRPKNTLIFNVRTSDGSGRITIDSNGYVKIVAGTGKWISLDGISWLKNTSQNIELTLEKNWNNLGNIDYNLLTNTNIFYSESYSSVDSGNGYSVGDLNIYNLTSSMTVSFFINPSENTVQNIISKAYGGEFSVLLDQDAHVSYLYGSSGSDASPYQIITSNTSLPYHEWSHVAFVRNIDEKMIYCYINGLLDNEMSMTIFDITESANELKIGKGHREPFIGQLTDILLYKSALTKDEIFSLSLLQNSASHSFLSPSVHEENGLAILTVVIGTSLT